MATTAPAAPDTGAAPDDAAVAAPVAAAAPESDTPAVTPPAAPAAPAVDPEGGWFSSKVFFPMIDAETGTKFVAGPPMFAKRTKWIAGQIVAGVLEEVPAP